MCEENMNVEVENQEEATIDLGDLLQNMEQGEIVIPPIELDVSNLGDAQIDEKEFKKGMKDASKLCGYITALKNVGLDNENILNYLLNSDTIDHNIKIAKMNNETQVKISEKQQVIMDKNQL